MAMTVSLGRLYARCIRSLDGDTDFFDIVSGVLQGDTLAPYLFIICFNSIKNTLRRL